MKAILYARFSPRRVRIPNVTLKKAAFVKTTEVLSNEVQFARIDEWCARKYHTPIARYQDEFKSGGSLDGREEFAKAIEHVKKIKGILVCYNMSRFARSARDALNVADDLRRSNAQIGLLDLDMDTSTSAGKAMFTMFAAFAEFQRDTMNDATSDAMLAQQATGKRISRYPPIGKRWVEVGTKLNDKGEVIPLCIAEDNPEELELIRLIQVARKETGRGVQFLTTRFNLLGYTFRGHPLNRLNVEKALSYRNELPEPCVEAFSDLVLKAIPEWEECHKPLTVEPPPRGLLRLAGKPNGHSMIPSPAVQAGPRK